MSEIDIPWQAILSILGIIAGMLFIIFYLVRYFKDDFKGVKPVEQCGDKADPKIVPLTGCQGPNSSISKMKADKQP